MHKAVHITPLPKETAVFSHSTENKSKLLTMALKILCDLAFADLCAFTNHSPLTPTIPLPCSHLKAPAGSAHCLKAHLPNICLIHSLALCHLLREAWPDFTI